MKEYTGEFTFSHQAGGIGYFAGVQLQVVLVEGDRSLDIEYNDTEDIRWKDAFIVGVRNAWRQLPSRYTAKASAIVRVLQIDSQPADTSDITVMFATANAIFVALEVTPQQRPEFIESFGCFVFPK